MGEERDKLIKRMGQIPVSEREDLTDEDLQRLRIEYYAKKGQKVPEIEALEKKKRKDGEDGKS